MGFDLYGINPIMDKPKPKINWDNKPSKKEIDKYYAWENKNKGVYFRNNVWWWRPLWKYVCDICEDILTEEQIKSGSYNDGVKINATQAERMADILQIELSTGNVLKFQKEYEKYIKELPDEECWLCSGTGKRAHPPKSGPSNFDCNGCNNTGKKRPRDADYPFDEENVRNFVTFLKKCGGFEIC